MILAIIYINYQISSFDFKSLFWALPFFIAFYYSIFFIIKKSKKIIPNKKNKTLYEMKYTIFSFLIFFIIVFLYFKLFNSNIINYSFDFNIYTIIFWIFFVVLHDAYFYFVHRFLHTKFMMKYVHYVHHKSNPSNIWSSYSFHPVEAIFYAWVSIIIFLYDINFYAFIFAVFYNDYFTILWHSWYELFWKNVKNTWFYKYFATTTYHDVHHSLNNWNIWLYFTYLDYYFWTRSKNYEKTFDKLTK